MEILYGKQFSKDLDAIRHATGIKAQLLKLVEVISAAKSFADLKKHILPVPFFKSSIQPPVHRIRVRDPPLLSAREK